MEHIIFSRDINYLLFPTGNPFASLNAINVMKYAGIDPIYLLERHGSGDFGDIFPEYRVSNMKNIQEGGPIFSNFWLNHGKQVWIITEPSRERIIIIVPSEGG